MDVLYHAATGVVISKATGSPHLLPAAISAVLPDLIGALPFYFYKLQRISQEPKEKRWKSLYPWLMTNAFDNDLDATVYRATHSLFAAAIFAAATNIVFPDMWGTLALSYLSHIIIDIPTHEGDFATKIFYPVSHAHLLGSNWAANRKLFFRYWAILGVTALILFVRSQG